MDFKQRFIIEANRVLGLLALLILLAIGLVVTSNWDSARLFLTDDLAFCLSLGRQVTQGESPLAGLPSHAGARHFSAAYLWLLGAVYKISLGKIENIFLWFTFLKFSALVAFCWIWLKLTTSKNSTRAAQGITLVVMLSLIINSHYLWLIRFEWVNNLMPAIGIFNLICFALLMLNAAKALPLFIFSSIIALGFHLGFMPILAAEVLIISLRIILDNSYRQDLKSVPAFILRWYNAALLLMTAGLVLSCLYYEVFFEANIFANLKLQFADKSNTVGLASASATFLGSMLKVSSSLWIDKLPLFILPLWIAAVLLGCFSLHLQKRKILSWMGLTSLLCCLLTIIGAARQVHVQDYFFAAQIPFFWLSLMLTFFSLCLWLEKFPKVLMIAMPLLALVLSVLSFRGYLHYQNFFSIMPQLKFLSLEHVSTLANLLNQDIAALNKKEVKLFVTGEQHLRRDAYYYLINSDRPDRFHYSRRMREFGRMQKEHPQPDVAYLIHCSSKSAESLDSRIARASKIRKKWQLVRELDLSACPSCSGCKVGQLAPLN